MLMTLMTPNPNSFQFKKFQNLQLPPIVRTQETFWHRAVVRLPRSTP